MVGKSLWGEPRPHSGELSVCVRGDEVRESLRSAPGGRNGTIPSNPLGDPDLRR